VEVAGSNPVFLRYSFLRCFICVPARCSALGGSASFVGMQVSVVESREKLAVI
jgi:hypothetical protein